MISGRDRALASASMRALTVIWRLITVLVIRHDVARMTSSLSSALDTAEIGSLERAGERSPVR